MRKRQIVRYLQEGSGSANGVRAGCCSFPEPVIGTRASSATIPCCADGFESSPQRGRDSGIGGSEFCFDARDGR